MNRNKRNAKQQIPKSIALATMASVLVGSQSQAAIEQILLPTLPNDDKTAPETPVGPYGGFFEDVANIHEEIQTTLSSPDGSTDESTLKTSAPEVIEEPSSVEVIIPEEDMAELEIIPSEAVEEVIEETPTNEEENTAEESEPNGSTHTADDSEETIEPDKSDSTQAPEIVYSQEEMEISSALSETPLFADVKTVLNIRSYPSMEGEIIGKLRNSDSASIVSYVDGWYEIISGDIRGFVSEKYALVGKEANLLNEELTTPSVTCTTQTLNIRKEANDESEVLEKISYNDSLVIDTEASPIDGWIGVIVGEEKGYVNEEFVEVFDGKLSTALTPEEAKTAIIHNTPLGVSTDEETLLAALLICEAGGSYDGMLAVGGVVMNRLRAGYSDSIRGVIYQRGQFSPAGSGKVDRTLASGVTEASLQAAREALSGVDITGGCLNFRAAFTGHAGTNIGGNVFF